MAAYDIRSMLLSPRAMWRELCSSMEAILTPPIP
jgi:hypothetical protein